MDFSRLQKWASHGNPLHNFMTCFCLKFYQGNLQLFPTLMFGFGQTMQLIPSIIAKFSSFKISNNAVEKNLLICQNCMENFPWKVAETNKKRSGEICGGFSKRDLTTIYKTKGMKFRWISPTSVQMRFFSKIISFDISCE